MMHSRNLSSCDKQRIFCACLQSNPGFEFCGFEDVRYIGSEGKGGRGMMVKYGISLSFTWAIFK